MTELLSVAGLALSASVALVGAILRYTVVRQGAERDRRFHELERNVGDLKDALHTTRTDVVRVEGRLGVLRSEHETLETSFRTDTIGRREWEARMNGFEDALRGIREQLGNVAKLVQNELLRAAGREGN